MNQSTHCRTSSFVEEFKFQYRRWDIHIHIATQNMILTFFSKWHFAWQCKYRSLPNFWNRNTFQTTSLHALQFQRQKIGYISQLNRNWKAHNRASFFNGFEWYVKLELFRSGYDGSKTCFYYAPCIGINIRFRGTNLYILQSRIVKLKLDIWEGDRFYSVPKCAWKK